MTVRLLVVLAVLALAGCGVETAGTAATAATLKKQELEQGQNALQRAKQKIGRAMELEQQHARDTAKAADGQ
jgi:hypothetical protein